MGITNTRLNLENNVARYKGEREATLAQIAQIESGASLLPSLKERITRLDVLIEAATTIVQENHPDWSADEIAPRRKANKDSAIPYGELGRTALEVLRDAPPEGLPTRDITRRVLERFGLDPSDRQQVDRTANSLGQYLKQNDGDLVESDDAQFYKRWRLIR